MGGERLLTWSGCGGAILMAQYCNTGKHCESSPQGEQGSPKNPFVWPEKKC